MALVYNPQTEEGSGFLVPLFKALHHLHNVTVATGAGWPITTEFARAEMAHANSHLAEMDRAEGILSKTLFSDLTKWRRQVVDLATTLRAFEVTDPDAILTAEMLGDKRALLKNMEQNAWALLSLLDVELLGWEPDRTDAGRLA